MLIRILILSAGLGIFIPISISIIHAADVAVKLDETDKIFLKQPIGYVINFPATSEDSLENKAAQFLNKTLKTNPKNYQALLNTLATKDQQMSKRQQGTTIPGSFLNAAASLYANIDIDTSSFGKASSIDKTTANIKGKQELLKFAALLQKAAKINSQSSSTLKDRIDALEKALAEAKSQRNLPPKIYIYSDSPTEKKQYLEIISRYYPHRSDVLVYQVVPEAYDPAYIATLTSTAAGFASGLVFFGRLPRSYPPFWSPVWHPFFHVFRGRVYAGWGGRSYNIANYNHQKFVVSHPKKAIAQAHTAKTRRRDEVYAAHGNPALTHRSKVRPAPKSANQYHHKRHTARPSHARSAERFQHDRPHHKAFAHARPHYPHRNDGFRHHR